MQENYLYHHGILGQKWGVRRFQNPDGTLTAAGRAKINKQKKKISSMYDHDIKWTDRKVRMYKSNPKKQNKAKVMQEMSNQLHRDKKNDLKRLDNMNYTDLKSSRRQALADNIFGSNSFMDNDVRNNTIFLNRLDSYSIDRGMRWTIKFTRDKTYGRMKNAKQGLEYLRRRSLANRSYWQGYSQGVNN